MTEQSLPAAARALHDFCRELSTSPELDGLLNTVEAALAAEVEAALAAEPKFPKTHCSQCGGEFGPGDHGYSHCEDHRADRGKTWPEVRRAKAILARPAAPEPATEVSVVDAWIERLFRERSIAGFVPPAVTDEAAAGWRVAIERAEAAEAENLRWRSDQDPDIIGEQIVEATRLTKERDEARAEAERAERDRDFVVSEYERAVKCKPSGYTHAAVHIYNAIVNAKCDANAERFMALVDERNAAIERAEILAARLAVAEDEARAEAERLRSIEQRATERAELDSWRRVSEKLQGELAALRETIGLVLDQVEVKPYPGVRIRIGDDLAFGLAIEALAEQQKGGAS